MPTPKAKTTAVTKAEEKGTGIANIAPDFMKGDVGKGVESLGASDVEIPRLILLQALSPEVEEGDFKAGQFFHSTLEETIGDAEGLRIVPIFADVRYILWRPRHEGGGILARADDGVRWNPSKGSFTVKPDKKSGRTVTWDLKETVAESGLANWGSSDPEDENSQPAATKMWNFVVVLPDYPELGPMVLTFQRGAADVGKKFSGKLKAADAPSFGQIFVMTSKKVDKGSGDYYSFSLQKEGYVTSAEDYAQYKSLYETFKAQSFGIKDLDKAQDDEAQGEAAATPKGAIDV